MAHCLDEADHLPEGALLSQQWSIDAFDALRRFEALDDLVTRHGHLPTDWHPSRPTAPAVPHQVCRQEPGEGPTHPESGEHAMTSPLTATTPSEATTPDDAASEHPPHDDTTSTGEPIGKQAARKAGAPSRPSPPVGASLTLRAWPLTGAAPTTT